MHGPTTQRNVKHKAIIKCFSCLPLSVRAVSHWREYSQRVLAPV